MGAWASSTAHYSVYYSSGNAVIQCSIPSNYTGQLDIGYVLSATGYATPGIGYAVYAKWYYSAQVPIIQGLLQYSIRPRPL
jgi:hypothetical protein